MSHDERLSADEFRAFIEETRATVAARLADLDAIDADALPPDARAEYDAEREQLLELQSQLTDDAVDAELAATLHAGRELTQAEARALLKRQ